MLKNLVNNMFTEEGNHPIHKQRKPLSTTEIPSDKALKNKHNDQDHNHHR